MANISLTRSQVIIVVIMAVITCAIIIGGAYMILNMMSAPPPASPLAPTEALLPQEAATSTPKVPPTETPTPTPSDDAWARVKEAGKLVVGTSADYPPFEFYDVAFQLDGFDIALIREVGARLGLDVEIKDIAFDGLFNALALGQIDVSIAAISVTPERESQVSFSQVYLASQDGVLARQDSPITNINNPKDMIPLTVAVQRFSVYENWLRINLVDTYKMSSENLRIYPRIDVAVADLKDGRVDLVVMDLHPAQTFLTQGDFKIVGQGLSQQQYAIALRQGAGTLQVEINRVLAQLYEEGRLSELAQQKLGISPDQMPPLPTPRPIEPAQPTPSPSGKCLDGMEFVQDLSYPDFNMTSPPQLPPGVLFRKGWRVRNIGTCTWNSSYVLRYVGGNSALSSMGGQPAQISGRVSPGQEYDIFIDLVSPIYPGVYQGFWQLHNDSDVYFGERLWVGIQVLTLNPGTPTPQPGSPVVQRFGIFPNDQINLGACVNVRWIVMGNITNVQITRNGQVLRDGAPLRGEFGDCPPNAGEMVYRIKAMGPGGMASATDDVWVIENPEPTLPPEYTPTPTSPPPPSIASFVVDPQSIALGQCFNLEWDVNGEVDLIQVRRNQDVILDNAPDQGNGQDCPKEAGVYTYRIYVSNQDGQSAAEEREVEVTAAPAALDIPAWQRAWRFLLYSIVHNVWISL